MKKLSYFLLFLFAGFSAAHAVELGEDGLHIQPWFSTTFNDMAEDMATAKAEGKRLAIIIEQRGCIYCDKLHREVFSDPKIQEFISKNFMMVQYNMFGDEEVTDLDGEVLSEKKIIRKWRLNYTPTIVFLPETPDANGGSTLQQAVSVLPGAFGRFTTLDMFRWVKEKGYEKSEGFQKYHARNIKKMKNE